MLKDIFPGDADTVRPSFVGVIKDRLVFNANDGAHGNELWVTDGTGPGTVLLKDLNPGIAGSYSRESNIVYKDRLFFTAYDGAHGEEIWMTDGTPAGTSMLADMNPDNSEDLPLLDFSNRGAAVYNGLLYFRGVDGAKHSLDLFVTDGTAAGTRSLGTGDGYSLPYALSVCNGSLYYSARFMDSDSDPYLFTAPVSIPSAEGPLTDLGVFPNPASDQLKLRLPASVTGQVNVKITDLNGRAIRSISLQAMSLVSLDISGIAAGNYILHIDAGIAKVNRLFTIK